MLKPFARRRRRLGPVAYDERAGTVCDARCRALARREQDFVTALRHRGLR